MNLEHVDVRRRRNWWTWFGLLAAACALWAVAMPLFGPPDEEAHAERAYVVVRGRLSGEDRQTMFGVLTRVRVAHWFDSLEPRCFIGREHVTITPSCVHALPDDSGNRTVGIVMGAYGPWYYALVGLPTIALTHSTAIYLMRGLTVLLCAAFLASAFASAQRLGRWALVGVAAAATPMAFYLAGAVNPNGLEIASAIAIWTTATALALAPEVDERLLARAAIAYAVCANTRGLSLPMASLALVAPLVLSSRVRVRVLAALPRVRWWLGVVVVGALVSLAWSASAGIKDDIIPPSHFTFFDGLQRTWRLFDGSVAIFGWSEVRVPVLAFVWLGVFAILVLTALVRGRLADRAVVIGTAALAVVVPIIVSMLDLPPIHSEWHGRYTLPIEVGVPILAGAVIARRPRRGWHLPRPTVPVVLAALAAGQVLGFAVASRRYTVGKGGRLLYFIDPSWSPPVAPIVLLVSCGVVFAALAWHVATVAACERSLDRPAAEAVPTPTAPLTPELR